MGGARNAMGGTMRRKPKPPPRSQDGLPGIPKRDPLDPWGLAKKRAPQPLDQ